uniref:Uncharacterized protein n=1 Tax=Setaria italica TaxID=4555 RepID=K3Y4K8_SETIT
MTFFTRIALGRKPLEVKAFQRSSMKQKPRGWAFGSKQG